MKTVTNAKMVRNSHKYVLAMRRISVNPSLLLFYMLWKLTFMKSNSFQLCISSCKVGIESTLTVFLAPAEMNG
jgi:hypothetical protein